MVETWRIRTGKPVTAALLICILAAPCSDGWVFVGRTGIFSRDVDRKMSRRATVHLASSNDGVANAGVKKKMEELEMLRLSIAEKRGNNVAGAPAFAIAKEQAEKKEQEEAKKKEFAELNRMLEEMMAQKRNENDEKIARVQAKRGLSGIKAIADEHAAKHRRMQEIRRNTETIDAVLGLRRGTGSAFANPEDLWTMLPQHITSAFTFSRVLGRGSFGVVVLAERRQAGAQQAGALWEENCDITGQKLRCSDASMKVAVKMLLPRKGEEPIAMREGLVLATIGAVAQCELVPKCLDYGIAGNIVYVVLEFFDGVSLAKVLEEEGTLSPAETAEVGAQVAEALGVIHRAGFVYRDVKPENILRCSRGADGYRYRLIDFGSATGIDGCLFGGMNSRRASEATAGRVRMQTDEAAAETSADKKLAEASLELRASGAYSDVADSGFEYSNAYRRDEEVAEEVEEEVEDTCQLAVYGHETAERLRQVFRAVDKDGDGRISTDELTHCFRAVGIREDLARTSSIRLVTKFSASSSRASSDDEDAVAVGEDISEEQFFNVYGELVRQQDQAAPVGTFAFMAPEQFELHYNLETKKKEKQINLGRPSPATDIYSLGVTLFALASGRLPQEPLVSSGATIEEQRLAWAELFYRDLDQPLKRLGEQTKLICELMHRDLEVPLNGLGEQILQEQRKKKSGKLGARGKETEKKGGGEEKRGSVAAVPAALEEIVATATRKRPWERPDAFEMHHLLATLATELRQV